MNVLLSPQPPHLHHPHQHDASRISPPRSLSPFHTMSRKRKMDDDGDEMIASGGSPVSSSRQLARPSKKVRQVDITGRPLVLPRLLETLDVTQLRTVLERICERHPAIGQEVVTSAPRPTPEAALRVLEEYQAKLKAAWPYGDSSQDYTYYRVKQHIVALVEALADFTPQYLPPTETQTTISLQYLDGATKVIHSLPDWELQTSYRRHKDDAYEDMSRAWALVISEAGKRGGGFNLHTGGWQQILAKHHQQSGGRMGAAMSALTMSVGPFGQPTAGAASASQAGHADPNSIRNQLMSGTYGAPVRVGPW